jgi:hypothetical protein
MKSLTAAITVTTGIVQTDSKGDESTTLIPM